ncbi:hypothetical protein G7Z17_g8457 [Cylindrodendrum hubeiense]|uniref:Uncharacterized protein n=1 Tax=Cylindrodendrum hubeiense TaxID=595255 RepID=A0A9P5L6H7_9HYPO|nr:hypothetical protein G7Z17_g8457 [Cylindrodendrum hubeiense]
MSSFPVPVCTGPGPSKDDSFRKLFSNPLRRQTPVLTYAGYRRAIELYGNEDYLRGQINTDYFVSWAAYNPKLLRVYQRRANYEGYNITSGFAKPYEGLYFTSKPPDAGRKFQQPRFPTPNIRPSDPHPATPATSENYSGRIVDTHDSRDQLTQPEAIPNALKNMSGARQADAGDFPATCIGAAEIALVLAEMLEVLTTPNLSEESANQCRQSAREALAALGGRKCMQTFVDVMYWKFPKDSSSSTHEFGSTLRG